MSETVFLGGCPVIRPEGIYLDGHRVIRLGLQGAVGLGDVGDLLAYRRMWEPFIDAHLEQWRHLNETFEAAPESKKCPPGLFDQSQIKDLSPTLQSFCAALALTRIRVSDTDPRGILPQWNTWKNRSSAEVTAGALPMLEWHQSVVLRTGNQYKDDLEKISKQWGLTIELPDLPTFTMQQEIIARIEGAYITAKGTLQILGYSVAQALVGTVDAATAVAEGLRDTAREIPKASSKIGIAAAIAVVVVGGALVVYYMPRKARSVHNDYARI